MSSGKLPQRVATAANIGIIVACVVLVLGAFDLHPLTWLRSKEQAREPFRQAQVGDALAVPDVSWAEARRTVVLAVSQECGICFASLPFYSVLSQAAEDAGVRVIAVAPEPPDATEKFLGSGDVRIAAVRSLQDVSPPIIRLPAVLVVDDEGVIGNLWAGPLAQPQMDEVLQVARAPL